MGRDKASLPVGSGTILSYLVGRLGPMVEEVIVAGAGREDQRLPVRWVPDDPEGAGPLGGILAGLKAMRGACGWVVACDLPDVVPGLAGVLFDQISGYDAVVPAPGPEPEGVCAVYRKTLVPRIEKLLTRGDRSVKGLLAKCRVRYVSAEELRTVDPDLRSFRNLNTPEDYEQWLASQHEERMTRDRS